MKNKLGKPFTLVHVHPKNKNLETLTFYLQDYIDTLHPDTNCLVGVLNDIDYVGMTNKPQKILSDVELFGDIYRGHGNINEDTEIKAYFYCLGYNSKEYSDPGTYPIDLNKLLKDKSEIVRLLTENGFVNMNHIFEYENFVIFMKCDSEELTRFIVSRFLYSFIIGATVDENLNVKLELNQMRPFNNYYYPDGIKINIVDSVKNTTKTHKLNIGKEQ